MPLLYEFCELFGIQYAIGIGSQLGRLQETASARLQRRLARRYRRTRQTAALLFPAFCIALTAGLHQRRVCYKAEHTETGTNLRFLVTNLKGRSAFHSFTSITIAGNVRTALKNSRMVSPLTGLSCHRFRANAFRLLLHSFAYNLVNLFRLQLPSSMRSAQIETLRIQLFKMGARIRETARCIRIHLASGWPFQDLSSKP